MNLLCPNKAMDKFRPGHTSRRDVIRDFLNALNPYGIKLILYIHPSDGHDFLTSDQEQLGWNDGLPFTRWNDFINAVLDELVRRYSGEGFGYWADGGLPPQINAVVGRVRQTIHQADPDAAVVQNEGFGNNYFRRWADYGCREELAHPYKAEPMQVAVTITGAWWADHSCLIWTPELAFQYAVLQASVFNQAGGGVAYATGPYPGGVWEPGVWDFFRRLGEYVSAREKAVFGTRPSRSFITMPGTSLIQPLRVTNVEPMEQCMAVATESMDGSTTYVHVLRPTADRTINMSVPHDGKTFRTANLLNSSASVKIVQDNSGVHLNLETDAGWNPPDTVVVLR